MKCFAAPFAMIALTVVVLGTATSAQATSLAYTGFSGGENTINFTAGGFSGSPSVTYQGVTFTDLGSTGTVSTLSGFNGFGFFANFASSTPPASQGDAGIESSPEGTWIRMAFSTTVQRVGLLLATGSGSPTTWEMKAYDSLNTLLDTQSVTQTTFSGGRSVFLGLELTSVISYIEVRETSAANGNATLFDDLRFEAVPEPASLLLFAVGGLIMMPRRRKAQRSLNP